MSLEPRVNVSRCVSAAGGRFASVGIHRYTYAQQPAADAHSLGDRHRRPDARRRTKQRAVREVGHDAPGLSAVDRQHLDATQRQRASGEVGDVQLVDEKRTGIADAPPSAVWGRGTRRRTGVCAREAAGIDAKECASERNNGTELS